jgi:hypothetical protein
MIKVFASIYRNIMNFYKLIDFMVQSEFNKLVLSLSSITFFPRILLGIAEFKIGLLEKQTWKICSGCVLKLISWVRNLFGLIMDSLSWMEQRVITQSKKKDGGLRVRLARQANTAWYVWKTGLDKNDLCQIFC